MDSSHLRLLKDATQNTIMMTNAFLRLKTYAVGTALHLAESSDAAARTHIMMSIVKTHHYTNPRARELIRAAEASIVEWNKAKSEWAYNVALSSAS